MGWIFQFVGRHMHLGGLMVDTHLENSFNLNVIKIHRIVQPLPTSQRLKKL